MLAPLAQLVRAGILYIQGHRFNPCREHAVKIHFLYYCEIINYGTEVLIWYDFTIRING